MITAKQAREMATNKPYFEKLDEVYKWISVRASYGYTSTWIDEKMFTNDQLTELEKNGFSVSLQSENSYKITW